MLYDKSYVPEVFEQAANLYVKEVENKGRGVFSKTPIKAGHVIEICPVLPLDSASSRSQVIRHYFWHWRGDETKRYALPFGYGPLYNHSYQPNAKFLRNYTHKFMTFLAIKDIAANEEILINYNGRPDDTRGVDFQVVG